MKILALLFVLFISIIQYKIWWGQSSFSEINQLKLQIEEQKSQNKFLSDENDKLRKEIIALRTNPKVLEEKARESLGLIKPGETFYRIIPKDE